MKRALGLSLLLVFLTGCVVGTQPPQQPMPSEVSEDGRITEINALGVFEDFNEVMEGTVKVDTVMSTGFIRMRGLVTGMVCVGRAELLQVKPGAKGAGDSCETREGKGQLTCSDDRIVGVAYKNETCEDGAYGVGVDQFGNKLHFAFGMDKPTFRKAIHRALKDSSKKEAMPAYDPEGHRAKHGFSTGTGFFINETGLFVTNHHVVKGASNFGIVTPDGFEKKAKLVRSDAENDIALLQLEKSPKTNPLPIGKGFDVSKGQDVFTLGYPQIQLQGQEQKATFGRVNAFSGPQGDERFAQVDVPIQPGNSGGPLIDMTGRVVGIMTATLDPRVMAQMSGGALPQNVNYALKVDYLRKFLNQSLGKDWDKELNAGEDVPLTELIRDTEPSVVLVIAQ